MLFRSSLAAILVASVAATPSSLAAEAYPARPIRLIFPYAPSGGADGITRALAQKLGAAWGRPVVVDSRPGANTVVGTEIAARAPPDGYTILLVAASLTINHSLRRNLPYDATRDFAPITQLVSQPHVLVVHPSFPAKSISELIALARAKPGQLNFGSSGTGSGQHFSGELFKAMAGVDLVHIPYKGGGPALTDLLGAQINLIFSTLLGALPHVKSGRLQAIAVSTARRSSVLPNVPTVAESGVPGFESSSWYGLLAPAGTPGEIVAKLNREIVRIVHTPEMRDWIANDGAEAVGSTPAAFAALIKSEIEKWSRVIRTVGIKPE